MATQTRIPTADQTDGSFTRSDTGTNTDLYSVVADANDTTYILRAGGTSNCLFAFTAFDAPGASDTINYVRVRVRAQNNGVGSNSASGRIQVNGTAYNATAQNLTSSWVNYDFDWATNPNTGIAWTVDDVKGTGAAPLQYVGWSLTGVGGSEEARAAEIEITVDYTPAAGGSSIVVIVGMMNRQRA